MELPKKLEAPEYCTWSKESPEAKINELIDYLESQKEGKTKCEHNYLLRKDLKTACVDCGEEPKHTDGICQACRPKEEPNCTCYTDNVGGNCKWCREEPKQVDVERLLTEYTDIYNLKQLGYKYDQERMQEIKQELKQALQQ